MPSRREFLAMATLGASTMLAGCGSIPIIGCSKLEPGPPEMSFSLTWMENERQEETQIHVQYDSGPPLDASNTGRLWWFLDHKEGTGVAGDLIYPGSLSGPTVPDVVEPGYAESMGPRELDNWGMLRMRWAPPNYESTTPRCATHVVEEWPEPPERP